MNFTKEQLDVLIAALEAQRAQMPVQAVKWMVIDRDGDLASGPYQDESRARQALCDRKSDGAFKPYTLYRCEPVA